MYKLFESKGVILDRPFRKQIKDVMNEYKGFCNTQPQKVEFYVKPIVENKWKPYPIED